MQKIGTEGTKVTTISIDADTLAILDQVQVAWDCGRSEAIRRIVADWLGMISWQPKPEIEQE